MTSKKAPPQKPPGDAPAPQDPLAGQPIEVLIDSLARSAGEIQGLQGDELKKFVVGVALQMQRTINSVEQKMATEATRPEAAAEVRQLLDLLIQTGTTAGETIEKHRGPITNAFRQADLQKLGEGMRALAEWMSQPTAKSEAEAKDLMEQLQAKMGPVFGHDPELAKAQRKEAIKADARRGLEATRANLEVPDLKVRNPLDPANKDKAKKG